MKLDLFDKILIFSLILSLLVFLALIVQSLPEKGALIDTRNMEHELVFQARLALLDKLFAPVTLAMQAGQLQEALLRLEEINVRYPGEAHGLILKGEILNRLEIYDKAAASFVQGVKLNGDYIDRRTQVTRRAPIEKLVTIFLPKAVASYSRSPGNTAFREDLANLNYLKSRLAGGCE